MEPRSAESNSASTRRRTLKLHWHILLTHFPIGTSAGAFLFMILHVATKNSCYVLAASVSLIAGVAVIIPTTVTGWRAWKRQYGGSESTLFQVKIWTSVAMIPLNVGLVAYQQLHPFIALDIAHRMGHFIFFSGVVLLMIGSFIEGYWGARLHHH